MKKVILTGATGLIGQNIIEPLKNMGYDIWALTIDENNTGAGTITFTATANSDSSKRASVVYTITPKAIAKITAITVTEESEGSAISPQYTHKSFLLNDEPYSIYYQMLKLRPSLSLCIPPITFVPFQDRTK